MINILFFNTDHSKTLIVGAKQISVTHTHLLNLQAQGEEGYGAVSREYETSHQRLASEYV